MQLEPGSSGPRHPSRPSIAGFFASPSAGGVVLAIAAMAALVVSNGPLAERYAAWLATPLVVGIAPLRLVEPLVLWVNDLWMAVFFFVVGLEIKREFVEGGLSSRRRAVLPVVAALAGMVVPALIYAGINRADPVALRGWAIPAATDIAFAIGVLALLGSRVPASLRLFLTAVAIIDDLGAIVVIAAVYTAGLSLPMLGAAGAVLAVLVAMNLVGVTRGSAYAVVGLVLWVVVLKSGVHATVAGVLTALCVPLHDRHGGSPLRVLERRLHPWVTFVILPVFAFCNAGVHLAGASLATLLQPVPMGIVLGLVAGKAVGVFGASWAMVRGGVAALPLAAGWGQFFGACVLCGIGFTMSLFIGGLAFAGHGDALVVQLKLGVLVASITSGAIGSVVLLAAHRRIGRVAATSCDVPGAGTARTSGPSHR